MVFYIPKEKLPQKNRWVEASLALSQKNSLHPASLVFRPLLDGGSLCSAPSGGSHPPPPGELSTRNLAPRWSERSVHEADTEHAQFLLLSTFLKTPRWSRAASLSPVFYHCRKSKQTSLGAILEEEPGGGAGRDVDQMGENPACPGAKAACFRWRSVGERQVGRQKTVSHRGPSFIDCKNKYRPERKMQTVKRKRGGCV